MTDYNANELVPDFGSDQGSNECLGIATAHYKKRGYYDAGGVFETWVTTDVNDDPPSGHVLSNLSIAAIWSA